MPNRRNTLRLASKWLSDGDVAGAHRLLSGIVPSFTHDAEMQHVWGVTLAAMGEDTAALSVMQSAVTLDPARQRSWQALGDLAWLLGNGPEAGQAFAHAVELSVRTTGSAGAAACLVRGSPEIAEKLLKAHVQRYPDDVQAYWVLAQAALRAGRVVEAEAVLQHCLTPPLDFAPARHTLAVLLYQQQRWGKAAEQLWVLVGADTQDATLRKLLATALVRNGAYPAAIKHYEWLLARYGRQPRLMLLYGHALKAVGRAQDAVRAYRGCIRMVPDYAAAYLSLADMKTARFTMDEMSAMRSLLGTAGLNDERASQLNYALGQALETEGEFEQSFACYAEGARLRRRLVRYDAESTSEMVARTLAVATAVLDRRRGLGCASEAPIFIVGLPRSGSTLVEQILASHSLVEGTSELPFIGEIAADLSAAARQSGMQYPEVLASIDHGALSQLGERYLTAAGERRRLATPYFTDKMPENFLHAGLIHLILPGAKIIDVRRAPMAAGFAAFKQSFAERQEFSYDLREIGRYYRDYVALMEGCDRIMPGLIHRVTYETLVTDTENQVRRLLEHCGLPFEPACLRFWETVRAVDTPSAQQVRQPISLGGLEAWRRYEPWLGPLRDALG